MSLHLNSFLGGVNFSLTKDPRGIHYMMNSANDRDFTIPFVKENLFLYTDPRDTSIFNYIEARYFLASSCRLDNRTELAKKLNLSDSLNDREYLLAAYLAYGENCTRHLLGDFSFAIWDSQEQTLFMAKDHLGIRPLFYYRDKENFLFSTSVHSLKTLIKPELNLTYIAKELKNYPQEVEDTFFTNIHRFPPAHSALFSLKSKQLTFKRYWELNSIDISGFSTEAALYTELNRRFTEAVMCRTRTTKNIGCQLSGGMDSSAIAVILSRHLPKERLHTYAFVLSDKTRPYSERGVDEQGTQQSVIDYAGLLPENHHRIEDFHFKDVFEQLERSNQVMGGYANSDSIWQDSLFKTASGQNVGIMMSGFPGDECISNNGNLYYYDYIGQKNLLKLLRFLRKEKLTGIKKLLGYYRSMYKGSFKSGYSKVQQERNLLRADSPLSKTLKDTSFSFYPTFKKYLKNQICRQHTCLRTESESAYASTYGIEMVYPLADIRLIELVYSLPTEMFEPKPYTRAVFRNLCKEILPEDLRTQPKFNGAMTLAFAEYWLKKQLEEFGTYSLKDSLHIFNKARLNTPQTFDQMTRLLTLYKMDYMINKNLSS